jgi:transposase
MNIAEAAAATAGNANVSVELTGPENVVGDKGYHSNESLKRLQECEVRSYISEPDRGRRCWKHDPQTRQAVYENRRRIRGDHGKALLRRRGELVERSFAHAHDTGGMRRLHLRGHDNILKRLLIQMCGFNLSLILRKYTGKGTPCGWQGYSASIWCLYRQLLIVFCWQKTQGTAFGTDGATGIRCSMPFVNMSQKLTFTTDC